LSLLLQALAIYSDLDKAAGGSNFESLHWLSVRSLELHFSALKLAERIWGKSITYEKAETALSEQFSEFPNNVCKRALGAAYAERR
jgi:hypothetical protein